MSKHSKNKARRKANKIATSKVDNSDKNVINNEKREVVFRLEDIELTEDEEECMPHMASVLYNNFPSDIVKKACLEYVNVHNYDWGGYSYPSLKFTPTTASGFLKKDYPGDMTTAMSLNTFADFYKTIENLPEDECQSKIRQWCIVICGIGQAVYHLFRWFPHAVMNSEPEEVIDYIISRWILN